MTTILRRRRLGKTSCNEISNKMVSPTQVWRSWTSPPVTDSAGMLIRWGCTANIPFDHGMILNKAAAIHQVSDKLGFRRTLEEAELGPKTYFSREEIIEEMEVVNGEFTATVEGDGILIIRPPRHSQGRNLHVCTDMTEVDRAIMACHENFYAAELVRKVSEYRVFVVQGRAVAVAKKTPGNPEEVAWNVARGGRFDNVRWDDWPLKAVKKSIEAFNLSDLDFGGVDVMIDAEGKCYILEINSAPSLTSEYRQTCMAKAFDYIVENGRDRIPLKEERGGYRKFVHPAVCDRAEVV